MDLLRPYLLLACAAFMVGFASYFALGHAIAPAAAAYEAPKAPLDALSSAHEWNIPKQI